MFTAKPFLLCLFWSFFIFSQSLIAQVTVGASVLGAVNASYVTHNKPMKFDGIHTIYENGEFPYLVVFKDNTRKTVRSSIHTDTMLRTNYLIFVDKSFPRSDSIHRNKRIYPGDTRFIFRTDAGNGVGAGIPRDSCWMFPVISDHLKAYSYLSEQESVFFEPSTIVGLQLNDGPIVGCTMENLKQIISSDPSAVKEFDKKNYYMAIYRFNTDAAKK